MQLPVIQIGDSKGIRLPQSLLEKYNITDVVELILEDDHFILKSKNTPRKGWEKEFKKMHQNGDDKLTLPSVFDNENVYE